MKIFDAKTGIKKVVFKEYDLTTDSVSCPECNYLFKEHDNTRLKNGEQIRCAKCGAKLKIGNNK